MNYINHVNDSPTFNSKWRNLIAGLHCWIVEPTYYFNEHSFHRTSSYFSVTFCYSLAFNINSKSKALSFQLNCIAYMHFRRLYYARSSSVQWTHVIELWGFFYIKTSQAISVVGNDTYLFIKLIITQKLPVIEPVPAPWACNGGPGPPCES